MSAFFEGQSAVKIRLLNLGNLSDATTILIKYKKPDGTIGQWTATVENITAGIIFYNLLSTEPLTVGTWTFWASVTFSDGRIGIGEPKNVVVKAQGR